jgi:hypothetical protein
MPIVYSVGRPNVSSYDTWGGAWHDPSNWIPYAAAGPNQWILSGETDNGDRRFGSVADLSKWEASKSHAGDPNSPHFNPTLAAAWLKLHPNANTPPLEGQKEGDYNPDIYRLVNGSGAGTVGTGGLGTQATNNSPADAGQVGASPTGLNPNSLDLAGALNLFKQYNSNKSQVNVGMAPKYYNPVQFRGFSLI